MSHSASPVIDTPVKRPLILVACMLAMFMAAIEATIIATAMPTIIADLGGFSLLGWVFAVYLLTQAITMPIYGRLADLYGRKPIFFFGVSLFLIGSILCGLAPSMGWLILFRALQGLGAGAITPIAATIIADTYSATERPKVQGYLSSVWGVAAVIGPLLGAFIVQHFSWSMVFWINVPIGCIAMLMLARYLPDNAPVRRHQLDILGTCYLALGVAALLLALLQAEWLGIWLLPLLLLVWVTALLLIREERRAPEPLFPLALWHQRVIVAGNLGNLVSGAAMMGVSAFLPTYVQGVLGGSALQAGSALAMMSIGWPLASTLSGRIMLKTSYRFTAITGSLLLLAGCSLLLQLQPGGGLGWGQLAAFVIGTGMGMCSTTFMVAVQNNADYSIRGIATASTLFSRMLGAAIGTAILSATLNLNLHWRLPQESDPVQQLMGVASRAALSHEHLMALTEQVGLSLHWVFVVALLTALLTLVAALLIPRGLCPATEKHQ